MKYAVASSDVHTKWPQHYGVAVTGSVLRHGRQNLPIEECHRRSIDCFRHGGSILGQKLSPLLSHVFTGSRERQIDTLDGWCSHGQLDQQLLGSDRKMTDYR